MNTMSQRSCLLPLGGRDGLCRVLRFSPVKVKDCDSSMAKTMPIADLRGKYVKITWWTILLERLKMNFWDWQSSLRYYPIRPPELQQPYPAGKELNRSLAPRSGSMGHCLIDIWYGQRSTLLARHSRALSFLKAEVQLLPSTNASFHLGFNAWNPGTAYIEDSEATKFIQLRPTSSTGYHQVPSLHRLALARASVNPSWSESKFNAQDALNRMRRDLGAATMEMSHGDLDMIRWDKKPGTTWVVLEISWVYCLKWCVYLRIYNVGVWLCVSLWELWELGREDANIYIYK